MIKVRGEICHREKKYKDRLAMLLHCKAERSEQLLRLVMGKYANYNLL
jgi:hypothetical protein